MTTESTTHADERAEVERLREALQIVKDFRTFSLGQWWDTYGKMNAIETDLFVTEAIDAALAARPVAHGGGAAPGGEGVVGALRDIAERAIEAMVRGDASGNPVCLWCGSELDAEGGHHRDCVVPVLEDALDAAHAGTPAAPAG